MKKEDVKQLLSKCKLTMSLFHAQHLAYQNASGPFRQLFTFSNTVLHPIELFPGASEVVITQLECNKVPKMNF